MKRAMTGAQVLQAFKYMSRGTAGENLPGLEQLIREIDLEDEITCFGVEFVSAEHCV